jgi:hypothetical protein
MVSRIARVLPVGLCLAPSLVHAEQPFTNEALARGINYQVGFNFAQFGASAAFVDLDADGDPDVVATGATSGLIAVYENTGAGQFVSRTAGSGLVPSTGISGLSSADYDADGDTDLFISRYVGLTDLLYRNDGAFHFTDVSAAAGVNTDGAGMASAWGDYNADGRLDLYVAYRTGESNSTTQNRLYRNNGDGTFTDVAAAVGAQRTDDPTLVVTFFDYDRDGDADLYLGTDKGSASPFINHLLRNDGGVFTDVTDQTGTAAHVDCMGIAYGDLDHDGAPDLFLTNVEAGHVLLMNNGDGTWTDHADDAGVRVFQIGWGCAFLDYNNDTREDLFIVHANAANTIFRNDGVFPLVDVGAAMGFDDAGTSYNLSVADIDNDGDLDVLTTREGAPLRLSINPAGDGRLWARLRVMGAGHNTQAIGAQAFLTHAGLTQFREVRAGCNYKSDSERTLHFGLGDDPAVIARIEVRWPNSSVRRVLRNYPPNHTWTVWHPTRLGDPNGNGSVDPDELAQAIAILNDHAGAPIDPGEEIFDFDGDCDVDWNDIASMLARYATPAGAPGNPGPPARP